ncbi:MAG TPA: hypothetical protein EYP62_07855 [Kiritimatiellae bacterium]|nr:hypothetical protein [Kiritimatiellia bacterium]
MAVEIQACGLHLRIEPEDAALQAELQCILAAFPPSRHRPDFTIRQKGTILTINGRTCDWDVREGLPLLGDRIIYWIRETIRRHADGYILLHGACVTRKDRAWLLLGDKGSGKSTTAIRYCLDGATAMCEHAVPLRVHDGRVSTLPFPLEILNPPAVLLRDLERQDAFRPLVYRDDGLTCLRAVPRQVPAATAAPAALVFLHRGTSQDGKPPVRLQPGAALLARLASCGLNPEHWDAAAWTRLTSLVEACPAFLMECSAHPESVTLPPPL